MCSNFKNIYCIICFLNLSNIYLMDTEKSEPKVLESNNIKKK